MVTKGDIQFSCSVASNSLSPNGLQHARVPCPSPTSQRLLKLMSIKSVTPSNHLILCCPLLLVPSIFPSIRVFSNESVLCIRWPKYWNFSFSISPSGEYSGLISFRIDLLDLLAVHGTLKSLLQHHSSEVSILQCSAFFIAQVSHPYVTGGKTITLARRTFVGKVMSLLFNMLSFPKVQIHMTQEVVTDIYTLCTWVSQISFLELMRGKDPHTRGEMAEAEPVGLSKRMAVSPSLQDVWGQCRLCPQPQWGASISTAAPLLRTPRPREGRPDPHLPGVGAPMRDARGLLPCGFFVPAWTCWLKTHRNTVKLSINDKIPVSPSQLAASVVLQDYGGWSPLAGS